MQDLVAPLIDHLTFGEFSDDSFLDSLNRPLSINWACEMFSSNCLETTKSKFLEYLQGSVKISKNLKSVIFCNGLRSSQSAEFDSLMLKLKDNENLDDRFSVIDGLGCFNGDAQIQSLLDLAPQASATEQLRIILSVIAGKMEGYKAVLEYLLENYDKISKFSWSEITLELSKRINDDEQFDKVRYGDKKTSLNYVTRRRGGL